MHPILAHRSRLVPYLAAWLPLALAFAGLVHAAANLPWATSLAFALPLTPVYAFICLAAFYPCKAVPLSQAPLSRVVLTHALAAVLSAVLWLFLAETWAAFLGQFPALTGLDQQARMVAAVVLGAAVFLYVLAAALTYLLIEFQQAREAERSALELRLLAREAELKALRAQIDPHFLFNSLNSVAALTSTDSAAARSMCIALAELMRESLRLGSRRTIPLADEVALATKYLAIEQIRFGQRLRFEHRIGAGVACPVPPLILQPLVENAVNRGIAGLLAGGTVRIGATLLGQRVSLAVENDCDPAAAPARGDGVGLANVRARVAALYGATGDVRVSRDGGIFRVQLDLPLTVPESDASAESA